MRIKMRTPRSFRMPRRRAAAISGRRFPQISARYWRWLRRLNARACIVLGADLAGLQAHVIQLFTYAVLERQCGLAMPIYPVGKYDGLHQHRHSVATEPALYGKRVRYPLTYDFAASGAMCARLARGGRGDRDQRTAMAGDGGGHAVATGGGGPGAHRRASPGGDGGTGTECGAGATGRLDV